MRITSLSLLAGAIALGILHPTRAESATGTSKPGCGNHGTSIEFLDSPSEAAARARKEQKLVFVLHVSGNFEDPRFT